MNAHNSGSVETSVLATPFRSTGAKAYVPVLIEADASTLLAGHSGTQLPVDFYLHAVDATGLVVDFFEQHAQLDIEKAGLPLREHGLKFIGHLELKPGEYSVRVLVRNSATGAYGKRAVVVKVPAFAAAPVLLPPLFPEAAGRWTVVRESPRGDFKDVEYPFVAGGQPFMPASLPTLTAGPAIAVAVVGYNLPSDVAAQAKLRSLDGTEMGECAVRLGGKIEGGEGHPDLFRASVRLPPGTAPGLYRLVLSVTAGEASDSQSALVRVGPSGG